jgi:hypothetical protein
MADLRADLGPGHGRNSLWSRLKEERFTNVDLLLVLGALMITGFIGAVTGVSLFAS